MQKRLHTQLPKLLLLLALLFGINSFGQAVLTENFSSLSNGENTTSNGSSTIWNGNSNFPNVTLAYQAGGAVKLGSGSNPGSITSRSLDLSSGGGSFTVAFSVKGWTTLEGSIRVTAAGTSQTVSYNAVMASAFETITLNFTGGTASSSVKIETTAKRAYIDNVVVQTAAPAGPSVTTTAATSVTATSATLNGSINANGTGATAASFEYGTSTAYGSTVTATPASVTGSAAAAIAATVAGLTPNTTYHFRAVGTQGSAINGSDQTFLTLANVPGAPIVSNANLTSLDVAIAQSSNPSTTTYVIRVVNGGTTRFVQSNGSLGTTEVAQTASTWGTRTISGLANNTAYTFSVKAKNGAGTDTDYSAATTGTTLADTAASITTGGTITASTTTYGTTSTPRNFTVSSANLTEDVIVTAPAGFEVSLTSGGTYTQSVAVAPNTTGTTVYIRFSATAAAGSYNDKVVTLTSGATTATKAIANSTVTAKALTISGLTAGTKVYDRATSAPVTGVAVLSGVVNGDAVTLGGTPSFNFADANVGTAKAITITGFELAGAGASNYTLTLPALTGSVTAKAVTIENAAAQNKVYDGSQTAVTTGTLTGVVSPDAVTYTAQFAQATAGENIAVNFALTGANAGNYTLTQPAVTANITKATPVFTNQPLAIGVGENVVLTNTAFEISNSNGAISLTSSNPAVASVNGTAVTGVAVGTATLTITQAEGTNYVAGSTTVGITVSTIAYETNDYRTLSSGTWITTIAGQPAATWERYVNGSWVSSNAPLANTSSNLYIQAGNIITAGMFASGAKLKIKGTFIQNAQQSTSASINVNDGGTIILNGGAFVNSGEFIVEANGTVIANNATLTGTSSVWNGTENFKSGSNFIIQNWNYVERIITTGHKFSVNADGYYFGNFTINNPTANFVIINGRETAKLCENNLTVSNIGTSPIILSNNSAIVTIGGDVIVNSGQLSAAAGGNPIVKFLGNLSVNGGTFNINQTSGSSSVATVELTKNLEVASNGTFTSGDPDSKTVFSGTTLQSINIAGTLGMNADFEVASGAEVQLVGQDLATANTNDFTVLNGGTLAFNNFNLTGAGAFTLAAGGTLKITDADGVLTGRLATGNVRTTGTRTYTAGGNYTYVGATPQATGNAVVNAGTITIDKTNTGDVVTPSVAIPTLGTIRVNRGVFNAGSTVVGGTATNFTLLANGKYRTSGAGTKPSAAGTYTIDPIATVDFYGTDATNIRTAPNYGIVLVSGTNVGLESATEGLKFNAGGSFEVTNESTFKVANATGFNGGTATAVTTTGNPAITLGATSNVVYNGTVGQTITAVNTTDGTDNEGYGNLTVTAPGVSQLGANLVYARNNFTLNGENASVVIETGKTLKVGNQVTENGGTINIENNGALLQVNDVDNTGTINVKKNSNSLYRLDYTMWSSPVSGVQTLSQFSSRTLTDRFYEYGIINGAEHYINIANTSELFTAAKGYLIRMPDTAPPATVDNTAYRAGTTPFTFTGTFTGTPNNGDVTIPASTQLKRFTAVGNPYPSPISVTEFFSANSNVIDQGSAIYFWRKRNGANTSAYATLTLAGQTAGYRANRNDVSADQGVFYAGAQNTWLISQGQGFIVKTSATAAAGANITFNNSMRRPAPATGDQAFFRTAQSSTSRLWLNLTSATEDFTQMAIAYIDGATTGLDYGYDGKMFGDSNTISLYTIAEDTKLAIQARPVFNASDIVPVGYKSAAAGQFTIELDHTDGVFTQGQNIYLKDNVLNIYHDLSEGNYSFATEAGTFNDRFEVVYTTEALGTTTPQLNANSVIIYKKDNTLSVNAGTAVINSVTVFDIRGRKLASKTGVNATTTVVAGLEVANEILIIEVNTVQGRISKKIVY